MGGQGIIFRIINQETRDSHIIKFAIRNNCDEIKHEAEILTKYNKDYRQPITFKPYLPLFYHDGVGAMDDGDVGAMGTMGVGAMGDGDVGAMGAMGTMGVRGDETMDVGAMGAMGTMGVRGDGNASSICFIVYEDVGYEDLNTFIRSCNTNPQELEDRIRMIPHILLQVALQLEYYKHYRHNDIRLQNIVVDVRLISTATATPIYTGTILKLSRVTIIDFGLFNEPRINKFSLLYIASQEALEHKYEHTFSDKQNSDLIGFFWVAIELLTLSQIGNMIIKELIRHVLSNRENMSVIKKDILDIEEMINGKTLLFIYQLLMHNSPEKTPISGMFNGMVIDKEISVDTLFKLIKKHYNSKILEILFKNNRVEYGKFIRKLFKLLTPTSIRPSIEEVIKWLRSKFVF
jgi:serine/threonine protein kinase